MSCVAVNVADPRRWDECLRCGHPRSYHHDGCAYYDYEFEQWCGCAIFVETVSAGYGLAPCYGYGQGPERPLPSGWPRLHRRKAR